LCPGCATRISDTARYCHSCALPIVPQETAGAATDHTCPSCGGDRRLYSRALGGERLSVSECHRCAGVWLGSEVFRLLEERAREREIDWSPSRPGSKTGVVSRADPDRPLYRKCPVCTKLMHRSNYGRRSGVIVDLCASHGIWFDQGELARILEWIRDGNLSRAERLRRVDDEKLARVRREVMTPPEHPGTLTASGGLARFLAYVVEYLVG
jgi:Zn-finger nucleic acid-binding protein